jgi:NAD(P)-dependent dehydrogenase (short-subunit alcohol dehydrogenase family)
MELYVDLAGEVVLVTGGSSGIGEAAVRVCLEAGANVAFCARGGQALDATCERLRTAGFGEDRVLAQRADVSNATAVAAFFAAATERFGGLNGVIHAAAVLGPIGNICDVEPSEWLRALEIDLFGSFLVVREACRHMRDRGGRIALFSGGGASGPFPNYSAYACSKVGVVRLTETIAEEMGPHGVAINCVAPGFVATNIHIGTLDAGPEAAGTTYFAKTQDEIASGGVSPELGARAAAFLISNAAGGITGKFVSAVHDELADWTAHTDILASTDVFTLRRILPRDRGMDWQ